MIYAVVLCMLTICIKVYKNTPLLAGVGASSALSARDAGRCVTVGLPKQGQKEFIRSCRQQFAVDKFKPVDAL
jgi:hypothetical protein